MSGSKSVPGVAPALGATIDLRQPSLMPETRSRIPLLDSKALRAVVSMAILLLAAAAHLSGVPGYLTLSLVAVGAVSVGLTVRAFQLDLRRKTMMDDAAARNRAALESLADRMWELQESEEHFRGLIDALGDLVIHRDRAGRLVYANKVFADVVGLDQRAVLGKTLQELGVDFGVVPDAAFAQGEFLSSTDVEIQTKTGTRWFSWIELSVRDKESRAASHRAIARDITARKMAEVALIGAREKAEHASLAKSRFLATVSHEIRTPMNGIAGMAKLLSDTKLSAEQRTYVSAIATSSGALIALIEDLLDFSKIESGRFEPEPQPMSPRVVADNVVELLALRAYDRGIGIGCHVAPDVPRLIEADPGRLRQILINLIGNAIKFTASGGVTVEVDRVVVDNRDMIRFAVSDTGNGISEADRERVFGEFEQADTTSTRSHGGLGLGLAISRGLVKSMGGAIRVDGKQGVGSVFSFTIPIRNEVDEDQSKRPDFSGRHYVVVSANAAEAKAIELSITAHGGITTTVATAADAMALIPDSCAILVDAAQASEMAELAQLRLGSEPHAVIMISPEHRSQLPEFRSQGYETFLARPVRSDTLVRVLGSRDRTAISAASTDGSQPSEAVRPGSGLRVLLAEDNEINALLARATLTKAGHSVEIVSDGQAAVDAIVSQTGKRSHDVVLMDLHMPVMDGLHAIAAIRRHESKGTTPPVPIMVLSADGQEATRHEALVAGANGFIAKPLDPEALVRAVERQVELA